MISEQHTIIALIVGYDKNGNKAYKNIYIPLESIIIETHIEKNDLKFKGGWKLLTLTRNYSTKELVLIGYIGFILYEGLGLILTFPNGGISLFSTLNDAFWFVVTLCLPPVLSILFYKLLTVYKKNGALLSILVSSVFVLTILLAQTVIKGLYYDLITYPIFLSTLVALGFILGFITYGTWIIGFEVYQRFTHRTG